MKSRVLILFFLPMALLQSCKKMSANCEFIIGQYEWLYSTNEDGTMTQDITADRYAVVIDEAHIGFYKNGKLRSRSHISDSHCFGSEESSRLFYGSRKLPEKIEIYKEQFYISGFPFHHSSNFFFKVK